MRRYLKNYVTYFDALYKLQYTENMSQKLEIHTSLLTHF